MVNLLRELVDKCCVSQGPRLKFKHVSSFAYSLDKNQGRGPMGNVTAYFPAKKERKSVDSKFVAVVPSPGTFVYQRGRRVRLVVDYIKTLLESWPLVVLYVIAAVFAGSLLWFAVRCGDGGNPTSRDPEAAPQNYYPSRRVGKTLTRVRAT